MIVKDILNVLDQFAPYNYQEAYDNSNLLVGSKLNELSGVLISLDCTEEVVEEALRKNCNVIISHHPIIFKGLKKITDENYVQRTVFKAIQNNINLIAYHTNLDNVLHGVNHIIAKKIGLHNTSILQPKRSVLRKLYTFCPKQNADDIKDALFEAGAGKIGNYNECSFNTPGLGTFKANSGASPYVGEINERHIEEELKIEVIYPITIEHHLIKALKESHPYEEVAYDIVSLENEHPVVGSGLIGELKNKEESLSFLKKIKESFHCGVIKHTDLVNKNIKRVAICGGSGYFLLKSAILQKADVFITSDIKYHDFFDAEGKIVLVDIGHYESEQFTCELIKDILTQKFPKFAINLSETNTNPVNYLT